MILSPITTAHAVTIACIQSMLTRLSSCINDLAALFSSLRLQLNTTKSEFIWFSSRASFAKIPSVIHGLCRFAGRPLTALTLCVISELTMKHRISKITSVWFYHLQQLRLLREKVIMRLLVTSLVLSRIDYCNTVNDVRRTLLTSSSSARRTLSDDLCAQRRLVQSSSNQHVRSPFAVRTSGTVSHRRYTP